jgi:hypothetical protein
MESAEDSAVADFLQILEEHRRNCERQGKYVEAEIAKNRLDELKVLRAVVKHAVFIFQSLGEVNSRSFSKSFSDWEQKVHEENRRKEAMRSRQLAERLGVEEAHMLECVPFVRATSTIGTMMEFVFSSSLRNSNTD